MIVYKIKIGDKIVFKTNDLKKALHVIVDIFSKGHDDVYLLGGRIGSWR
jgi:hypothetical protein